MIIGSGEQRYECIHDWLKPPDSIRWGDTHGVAQDRQGRIYIAHTVHPDSESRDAVAVFDRDGNFLNSWGESFQGGAHGLDIRQENGREYLYHCDVAHDTFAKTTLDGEVVWLKGFPEESGVYAEGDAWKPTNIALAANGDFYVTDGYGSDWILQYDLEGHFIRAFGGRGDAPGKVAQAHGIWIDDRGDEPRVLVADRANRRLQYFTLDGEHVGFLHDGMRLPCHFDIREGLLLVPDLESVVTILDEDNRVVVQLGDGHPTDLRGKPREDFIPGRFVHPHSAKFLDNGDILVVEWVPIGRVTLLKKVA